MGVNKSGVLGNVAQKAAEAAEAARKAAEAAAAAAAKAAAAAQAAVPAAAKNVAKDAFTGVKGAAAGAVGGVVNAQRAVAGIGASAEKLREAGQALQGQAAGAVFNALSDQTLTLQKPAQEGFWGTVSEGLGGIYQKAKETAQGVKDTVVDVTTGAVQKAQEAVEVIGDTLGVVDRMKEQAIDDARKATVDPIINDLGKGDSAKISGTVGAQSQLIKGIPLRLEVQGNVEVKCEEKASQGPPPVPGKYVVSVDASVLGGVYAPVPNGAGGAGGPQLDDTNVMIGKGGRVEMTFDSPEAAAKAVETIARMQAPGGPLGPLAPPTQDVKDLMGAVSAVEIRDTGVAQIKGKVEIPQLGELGGGIKGKVEQTTRIEFKPPALVIKQSGSMEVEGEGEINSSNPLTKGTLGVKGEGKVEVETRIELDPSVDQEALKKDPLGTTLNAITEGKVQRKDKITLSVDQQFPGGPTDINGNGGARLKAGAGENEIKGGVKAGKGRTMEVSVTLDRKPGDVTDFLRTAVKERDLGGALKKVGDNATVEAKVTDYTEVGVGGEGKVGGGKVGRIDAKVEGTVRNVEDNPYRYPPPDASGKETKKTINDLVADLQRMANGEPLPTPEQTPASTYLRQQVRG
jgi:hypothetical protein